MRGTQGLIRVTSYLRTASRDLWAIALVFYGLGDLVTTAVGLALEHVAEAGPIASAVYGQFGPVSIVGLKLLTFGVAYVIWYLAPEPQNVGVPLGLATVGLLTTGWNLLVVAGVT